jgi:hypothetical protein
MQKIGSYLYRRLVAVFVLLALGTPFMKSAPIFMRYLVVFHDDLSYPSHAPMIPSYDHKGRPIRGPHNESTSSNWSGYALSTASYTSASGNWTVPKVTLATYASNPSLESSASWVGIGGFSSSDLIQLGTEQLVEPNGILIYRPWYELLPAAETVLPSKYAISPGDAMTASLTCTANCTAHNSSTTWTLSMTDSTAGWTWTENFTYRSSLSSAEWIEEAPEYQGSVVPLPNYGSIQFSNLTANGANPNLTLASNGIALDDQAGGNSTPCAAVNGDQFILDYGTTCTVSPGSSPTSGSSPSPSIGPTPVVTPTLVDTHDFNDDNSSDILWRDTAGDVGMWLMHGTTILQGGAIGNMATIWSVVGQRDFNGDGDSDLLWRDTSGDVAIWLTNGTQTPSAMVLGNVPTSWSVSGTGDFNGDGKGDILWRDTAGDVGIWFMNGTMIAQAATVGNMPTSWIIAGADVKGDIFWRNTNTGDVAMWVMNGTQIARSVDFGMVPLTWTIAGIGDFDGNGSFDILWRDTAGDIGIWLMNGTSIMSTAVLGNVPTTWSIAETGDYNGDGKSDILWIDTSGNVGAWFMNGTEILSTTIYGNVGTAWNVQSLNAD